jgi:hypothetical protein
MVGVGIKITSLICDVRHGDAHRCLVIPTKFHNDLFMLSKVQKGDVFGGLTSLLSFSQIKEICISNVDNTSHEEETSNNRRKTKSLHCP